MAKKTHTTTIKSREELEAVMGEYSDQVLERDRLTVEMEQRLAAIRAEYELPIAACVKYGDGLFEDMNAYAVLHPEEFGPKRSIELMHGTIGFRLGTPSVKTLTGVRMDDVIAKLKSELRVYFIRVKEELDKDRVLSEFSKGILDANDIRMMGLRVDQTDRFYAEIKREDGKGAQ